MVIMSEQDEHLGVVRSESLRHIRRQDLNIVVSFRGVLKKAVNWDVLEPYSTDPHTSM